MIQEDKDFLKSIESIRGRMTGRTTRMVDEFIQKLYKNEGEWVGIYDHYPNRNADRMIMEKIIRRMQFEHPQDKIKVDKLNNRIKLTWCQQDGLWAEIMKKKNLNHKKEEKDMTQEEKELLLKDPYGQCVQYDSIKAGIQSHAETYSFNIESELYNQLTTEEQQKLWRKEIEQACVSGGEVGVELARDPRYKENIEVKDADLIVRKTDWSPSKKQMESLKDMLKWNIGDFNYQKWMEVNSLYNDLTKILD